MLYNPKWDKTPSLDGFIAFLAGKPSDEEYNWASCEGCAIGQYLQSCGQKYTIDFGEFAFNKNGWEGSVACPFPHTFGAAHARALAFKEKIA